MHPGLKTPFIYPSLTGSMRVASGMRSEPCWGGWALIYICIYICMYSTYKEQWDRIICIRPLPRAPVFTGILEQVKKNEIVGYVEASCLEPQI